MGRNKKKYPIISELNEIKRMNLAWRIDSKTHISYFNAIKIAKIEVWDIPLNKVFEYCGMTPHQAKIHARKVINFTIPVSA
jgi:hypothetical protein